jgi:hypothetical protein
VELWLSVEERRWLQQVLVLMRNRSPSQGHRAGARVHPGQGHATVTSPLTSPGYARSSPLRRACAVRAVPLRRRGTPPLRRFFCACTSCAVLSLSVGPLKGLGFSCEAFLGWSSCV